MPTYNPKDNQASVDAIPVSGYADGTDVLQVVYDSEFVDAQVGVTGEGAFVEMNDRRATVTIKLLHTSPMNDVLSGLANLNTEFAFGMDDARGTTIYASAATRVSKIPDLARGNEIGTNEWQLRSLEMISNLGGSTS